MTAPSIHVRRLENRVSRTAARLVDLAARQGLTVADLRGVQLPWYAIRNQQPDSTEQADGTKSGEAPATPSVATVYIFDEIGGSLGVSAKRFAADLEAIDAPRIEVRINSPGGSVKDAIAIHSTLLHHPARIRTYVDGWAASAASVIAQAADPFDEADDSGGIIMMPGSEMMIHDASMLEDGNAADHKAMSAFLDRQSDNIARLYARRAGGDPAEWRELMLAETWVFDTEAVELRLADQVAQFPAEEAEEADADPELHQRMRRAHDLSQYGYRHAGRSAAPAPPARLRTAADRPVHARTPVTVAPRPPSDQQFREAAQRRAAAYAHGAPAEPPGGQARSVSTGWMHRSVAGRAATQPLPKRLTAKKVERDGKPFYVVEGYYTVHERGYEMWDENGPYIEIVSAGAGTKSLAAAPDVVFLTNHRGLAMARTVAGTLELWTDEVGDADRAWLNPNRQDIKDLVLGIEDGTITEQSFAFMIEAGHWNGDFTEYRIDEYDIDRGDTSAVNFGANPHTSIAARAREILDELDRLPAGAARAALDRLAHRADVAPAATTSHTGPQINPARTPDEPSAGRSLDEPVTAGRTEAAGDDTADTVTAAADDRGAQTMSEADVAAWLATHDRRD